MLLALTMEERGHQTRKASDLYKLGKARNCLLPGAPRRNAAPPPMT